MMAKGYTRAHRPADSFVTYCTFKNPGNRKQIGPESRAFCWDDMVLSAFSRYDGEQGRRGLEKAILGFMDSQ